MDWLTKIVSVLENLETQSQQTQNQRLTSVEIKRAFNIDPVKKRVFGIGAAFWVSALLIGLAYITIEDVSFENIVDDVRTYFKSNV